MPVQSRCGVQLQTPALLPAWQCRAQSQKDPSSTPFPSRHGNLQILCVLSLNIPHRGCSAVMLQTQRCRTARCDALAQPHDTRVYREPMKTPNTWFQGRGTCSWSPPPWRQGGCRTSPSTARRGAPQSGSERLRQAASPGLGMGTPGHAAAMWIQTLR